jgi:5-methylcytosine-specific restriction enzyme B
MSLDADATDKLWSDFLQRWPLDKLKSLTIQQYTKAGSNDTFTYWLQTKTEPLGSIGGGREFKFGIYSRGKGDDEVVGDDKVSGGGRIFGTEYAWYEKYGKTPEEAFSKVCEVVVNVATAARSGDLSAVEATGLGPAVRWKIAFLYQNRDHPCIVNIFRPEVMQALVPTKEKQSERYAEILKDRGDKPLFTFLEGLYDKGKEIVAQKLKHKDALTFLQTRFKAIKDPVMYVAGFETDSGRQLALGGRGQDVTVFVEPGEWQSIVPGVVVRKRYDKTEARNSNLQANAPHLSVGYPTDNLSIPTMAVLAAFCDAYESSSGTLTKQPDASTKKPNEETAKKEHRLTMNKILYGPPGTGKTYKTAQLAVEICDGPVEMPREIVMARYEGLRKEGRISFVTFHQSYGYEDFVEGLRPELKDGQVSYRVRPGIFRDVCDAARRSTLVKPGLTGKPLKDRTIYKMSLGVAGSSEGNLAFQDCIEKGYVLLGWGGDIDFSECKSADEVRKKVDKEGEVENPDSNARYLSVFKEELQIGDIVVVSQGNRAFRAIGEVTGEYEFLEAAPTGEFHQMRPVRWLAVFEGNRRVEEIYDRNFVQSTLYKLDHAGLKLDVINGLIKGQQGGSSQSFVLIIDEINRANISKVFGELITLLEPDKREGAANAITVKLPYSGDEFSVPSNLHIVGTMNTADRSIALLDTALRRRFDFEELQPDATVLPDAQFDGIDLRAMLRAINERIEYLYDRDHTIGHAYFLGVMNLADLEKVFRRKVIPLLQEYFFENWSKVRSVLNDKDSAFIAVINEVPSGVELLSDGFDPKPRYRVKDGKFPVDAYVKIYH